MNKLDFSSKTVLVVGGSSGIGNGIAQAFRTHGAAVHVWGTRPEAASYRTEERSNMEGLTYCQVDVSDEAAIAACEPSFQTLDVLVQSQGTVLYSRKEFEMAGFHQVVRVNLDSVMAISMKFFDLLLASRGSMVVVSSTAAFIATRGNPAYSASKAGAMALTRTLAQAWAPKGIRVNGIAPGFVSTKLTEVTVGDPARSAATLAQIPLGRFGTPDEMAGAALFLASPLSSYMTGQTLVVDGGMIL